MTDTLQINPTIGGADWSIRVYSITLIDGSKEYGIKVKPEDERLQEAGSAETFHVSAVKKRRILRQNDYYSPDEVLREHMDKIREYCLEYSNEIVDQHALEDQLEEEFSDEA